MTAQLTLDVALVSPGVTHGYCGIPDCDCGAPKLPDSGWRSEREKRIAEREEDFAP